jgi:hypothetical protein
MIKGVTFWNDKDCYYAQNNNPTEEILRKRSDREWLVSCGPTAAVNCPSPMAFADAGSGPALPTGRHRLGQEADPCYISTLILALSAR